MKKFNTTLSLYQIEKISGGTLYKVKDIEINSISTLIDAKEYCLTFYSTDRGKKFYTRLLETRSGAVIIPDNLDIEKLPKRNYIKAKNPYIAFLQVVDFMNSQEQEQELIKGRKIALTGKIAQDVKLPQNIIIKDNVVIRSGTVLAEYMKIEENVVIGKDCRFGEHTHLFPNVVIYPQSKIGKNVIIHSGTVIGSDGFGYYWDGTKHKKIPQLGDVIIEDDVEIGANVTIDRASLGSTIIKRGVKIDNLVQIAHNDVIGEDSILCAQVGIAGSTELGRRVTLAGQVGVSSHLTIGNEVTVAAQSGIPSDVEDGKIIMGYPAVDIGLQRRIIACMKHLPEMKKILDKLVKKGLLSGGETEDNK